MLATMKYLFVYSAYAWADNPTFKANHPDWWEFFTNQPSSFGFQSFVSISILGLCLMLLIVAMGSPVSRSWPFYIIVMFVFQFYTIFTQIGTYKMIMNFGLYNNGTLNVYVFQFLIQWIGLLCPFFLKPIDAIVNAKFYLIGLPFYYFSVTWWYVIVTIYSIANIDDVSWGNRPSNKSGGMNIAVDDAKR